MLTIVVAGYAEPKSIYHHATMKIMRVFTTTENAHVFSTVLFNPIRMRTFFMTSFAITINILMIIFLTILGIPVRYIIVSDYVNIVFCRSAIFTYLLNLDRLTIVGLLMYLGVLFLLINCLDPIFGLGFLGLGFLGLLLGAAQILDAEDDLHNDRFGTLTRFIGGG